MPKAIDLTEINKLENMLKEAGIPYEREDFDMVPREEAEKLGLPYYFEHHEIYYPSMAKHLSDAIVGYGSYGMENGLLEQMGLLPDGGGGEGYLTADQVFARWKEHFERSKK